VVRLEPEGEDALFADGGVAMCGYPYLGRPVDQVVVLYPGAFGALVFKTVFADEPCPVIAEVNNLPYDTRVTGPCKVTIFGLNRVNIAFMPAEKGSDLIDEMRQIHPYDRVYDDVLEAGLSIVNPGVHAGPCLTSISAIENWPKRSFFL
jgi:opine dehydrogenase